MPFRDLILDGGLATELERRGQQLDDTLWSARLLRDEPAAIAAVHRSYLDAGADIVTTASYQATLAGFVAAGIDKAEAADLLRRSVRLAKHARDAWWDEPCHRTGRQCPLVAASIGPYGAYLANGAEYAGVYGLGRDELLQFHLPRWHLLAAEQPDVMWCETLPCLGEAQALVELADQTPEIPVCVCFSCRDARHISDGTPIGRCGEFLDAQPRVQAMGVNCTAPSHIVGLIGELRKTTEKPIVVYPNSGEIWDAGSRAWRGEAMIEDLRGWRSSGGPPEPP